MGTALAPLTAPFGDYLRSGRRRPAARRAGTKPATKIPARPAGTAITPATVSTPTSPIRSLPTWHDNIAGLITVWAQGRAGPPGTRSSSPHNQHMVRRPPTRALVLLIQSVFRCSSSGGCLRVGAGKVATMRHRRDVLDVLFLIAQSTIDLSVFDTSVNVATDPPWSRAAATRSRGRSALSTSFGFLHRRMRRHQRDAFSLHSRAKTRTGGR